MALRATRWQCSQSKVIVSAWRPVSRDAVVVIFSVRKFAHSDLREPPRGSAVVSTTIAVSLEGLRQPRRGMNHWCPFAAISMAGISGAGISTEEAIDEAFSKAAACAVARARACDRLAGDSRRGGRRGAASRGPLVHAKVRGAVHERRCRPRVGEELLRRTDGDGGCDRNMERIAEPRQQLRGRSALGRHGRQQVVGGQSSPRSRRRSQRSCSMSTTRH